MLDGGSILEVHVWRGCIRGNKARVSGLNRRRRRKEKMVKPTVKNRSLQVPLEFTTTWGGGGSVRVWVFPFLEELFCLV